MRMSAAERADIDERKEELKGQYRFWDIWDLHKAVDMGDLYAEVRNRISDMVDAVDPAKEARKLNSEAKGWLFIPNIHEMSKQVNWIMQKAFVLRYPRKARAEIVDSMNSNLLRVMEKSLDSNIDKRLNTVFFWRENDFASLYTQMKPATRKRMASIAVKAEVNEASRKVADAVNDFSNMIVRNDPQRLNSWEFGHILRKGEAFNPADMNAIKRAGKKEAVREYTEAVLSRIESNCDIDVYLQMRAHAFNDEHIKRRSARFNVDRLDLTEHKSCNWNRVCSHMMDVQILSEKYGDRWEDAKNTIDAKTALDDETQPTQ